MTIVDLAAWVFVGFVGVMALGFLLAWWFILGPEFDDEDEGEPR